MTRALLVAMVLDLLVAVAAFATGHLVGGFSLVGVGLGCAGVAASRARPANWTTADTDQRRGSDRR